MSTTIDLSRIADLATPTLDGVEVIYSNNRAVYETSSAVTAREVLAWAARENIISLAKNVNVFHVRNGDVTLLTEGDVTGFYEVAPGDTLIVAPVATAGF